MCEIIMPHNIKCWYSQLDSLEVDAGVDSPGDKISHLISFSSSPLDLKVPKAAFVKKPTHRYGFNKNPRKTQSAHTISPQIVESKRSKRASRKSKQTNIASTTHQKRRNSPRHHCGTLNLLFLDTITTATTVPDFYH